jgi:hypothetical protein
MGIVEITLSMSLDGFITGPHLDEKEPLGTSGDCPAPGGERWMIDAHYEKFAHRVHRAHTAYMCTSGWSRCSASAIDAPAFRSTDGSTGPSLVVRLHRGDSPPPD